MKKVILLTVFTFLFSLGFAFAEIPCKINYQGRLIKDNVPVDGTVNMEFKLYTQQTGGTAIKTISISNVPVYNGLFRTVLDLEGINWAAGQTMYLEVKVGTDVLSPREEIYAYPYAINTRFLEGKATDFFLNKSGEAQTKSGNLNIMGRAGIGTTQPKFNLDVRGSMNIEDAAGAGIIYFPNTGIWPNFYIRSDDDPSTYEPASERLFIAGYGDVGIGTISPKAALDVRGAINMEYSNGAGVIYFPNTGTLPNFYIRSDDDPSTYEIDSERLFIGNTGLVGIGTTLPKSHLDVRGHISIQDSNDAAAVYFPNTGTWPNFYIRSDDDPSTYEIDSERLFIAGYGDVGIGTTSPKAKLDVRGAINMEYSNGAGIIYFPNTGTLPKFYIRSDDDPTTYEPASERLCIEGPTGNVGIGTQFPTSKLYVKGTFTATEAKNFEIDHPAKPGMKLVHSTLEGPEVAVFYRGEARLKDGQAVIQLPDYFEALTRREGRTVLLTAKGNQPYLLSSTAVSDGKFKVYGTRSDGEFYWEVKAIRADVEPLQVEK